LAARSTTKPAHCPVPGRGSRTQGLSGCIGSCANRDSVGADTLRTSHQCYTISLDRNSDFTEILSLAAERTISIVSAERGDAIAQGDRFDHRGFPPTQCFDIGPATGGKFTTNSTKRHPFYPAIRCARHRMLRPRSHFGPTPRSLGSHRYTEFLQPRPAGHLYRVQVGAQGRAVSTGRLHAPTSSTSHMI